jgi:hypothetical protein
MGALSEVVGDVVRIDDSEPRLLSRALRLDGLWAFVFYLAIGVLVERSSLIHLNSVCACTTNPDPSEYIWALAWFPHAILHGLNPFVTHELWAGSGGSDLALATFTPAEALVAWPITAVAGPLVAYNIVAILAPVVGAWTAYRLCLYLTRKPAASIVGGYLFGFSSYELGQMLLHLQLSVTFVIPAAVLLTLKRIDQAITARRYVALMAVFLAFQLLTSTEVLFTLTCMGALALSCAWFVAPAEHRVRIRQAVLGLMMAYGVMAIACSLYLYYAVSHPEVANAPISADALSFFIPTWITAVGSRSFLSVSRSFAGTGFPGDLAEQGTYLGLPLIAIVADYLIRNRQHYATTVLATLLSVAVLWTLGDHLLIDGHATIQLPWAYLSHFPLFRFVIPIRVGVYTSLLCAVIASLWLARRGPHLTHAWLLAGLAVALLFPNIRASLPGSRQPLFTARYVVPGFFSSDLYRRYLRPGEIVLPLPYGQNGYSLLWQARTDMYFRLASGRYPVPPATYPQQIANELMGHAPVTPTAPSLLRAFIRSERVEAVVADPAQSAPWLGALAKIGLRSVTVGGVLVYRVPVSVSPRVSDPAAHARSHQSVAPRTRSWADVARQGTRPV